MRPLGIYGWSLCLLALQTTAAAQSSLKWTFQRTGYRSTAGTSGMPQTALSMRGNLSWPVVYGFDQNILNAYSLFPVTNATGKVPVGPATNWHQIGTNLAGSLVSSNNFYLQADSGAPDGFGVSLQTPTVSVAIPQDVVVVGNSQSGFQSPQVGAQAVKFDDQGHPFIATNTTIPGLLAGEKLFDIATSPFGDFAAITQGSNGTGQFTYWQRSPLMGSNWNSTKLPINPQVPNQSLLGYSADLTFDTSGRPHILGVNRRDSGNSVLAFTFDVTLGAWSSSALDVGTSGSGIIDVAAAANDDGIVGAAWVNNGMLKYAYFDSNEPAGQWVVTSVASTTPTGVPLEISQGVGLAFDKAGLPVISFVDRTMRQIWVAYDPPSAFGGGVTDQPSAEGDFNGDGLVDAYDLEAWGTAYGADGLDGNDFLAWQRNLAIVEAPRASASVPEPLSLASGLVGAALLLGAAITRRSSR